MNNRIQKIALNIFVFTGILCLPYIITPRGFFEFPDVAHNPHERTMLFVNLFMTCFFFLNYHYLVPKFYFTKRYVAYFLICILFLIFFIVFEDLFHKLFFNPDDFPIQPHHHKPHPDHPMHRRPPPRFLLFVNISLFTAIGISMGILLKIRKYISNIESEKKLAEISFLKSQINPHFLFNTLNSVFALSVREKADATSKGILSVSNLMRYIVTDATTDFIELTRELDYINDFIELQKLRLDKGVILSYTCKGDREDKKIAPLLLIPFIENAFKYGVSPDESFPIDIHIDIDTDSIHLMVKNRIVSLDLNLTEKSGIGIANTQNRLRILYPGKHQLSIHKSETEFIVNLKIILI